MLLPRRIRSSEKYCHEGCLYDTGSPLLVNIFVHYNKRGNVVGQHPILLLMKLSNLIGINLQCIHQTWNFFFWTFYVPHIIFCYVTMILCTWMLKCLFNFVCQVSAFNSCCCHLYASWKFHIRLPINYSLVFRFYVQHATCKYPT